MDMKYVNLVKRYVKHRGRIFVLFTVYAFCFLAVFYLNQIPLDSVFYGFILCGYISLILIIVDFAKFVSRYQLLERLKRNITVQSDGLPVPVTIFEKQYQDLIQLLHRHKNELDLQAEDKQKDLVDYFTRWTHQIKTPIAAMRLLLQANADRVAKELEMELFKIEQYVEFVLQFIRLDNIANDLVLKRHSLDDIIKQAVRKNAKTFIHKKITLNFSETNCTVLTDAKWLLFVIEQILTNALKYTEQGSISIYMEQPEEEKRLVIEDTGYGIPDGDLPRVFEKGFTGYNGRIHSESTGMGLYLCKQIMNKLSHKILIQSEVGKGTRVILDLKTEEVGVE